MNERRKNVIYPLRMSPELLQILKDAAQQRQETFGGKVTVRSIILSALLSHEPKIRRLYLESENPDTDIELNDERNADERSSEAERA